MAVQHWRCDYLRPTGGGCLFSDKRKFRTLEEAQKCADELAQSGDFHRIEVTGPYESEVFSD